MSSLERADAAAWERTEELNALGFDHKNPAHRVAVKLAAHYGLDLYRKHLVMIETTPYITRDGHLDIAHRSKMLDGIGIVDQGETDKEWWAVCQVWRKDMSHPITYRGRYPKSGTNKRYGPEMAIARAESMALRRAFAITGLRSVDEADEAPEVYEAVIVPDRVTELTDGIPGGWDDLEKDDEDEHEID